MARLFFTATLVVSLVLASLGSAVAQSKLRKAAEESLRAGVSAQKTRKHAAAIGQFNRAINSGGLARKQLTYALFRRAVSHRAVKQPAQAISDLNSALFFQGDLSTSDRAAALKERTRAYKDAGLKPTAVATAVPQGSGASTNVAPATKSPEGRIQPRKSLSTLPPTAPILGGPEPKPVRQSQQRAAKAAATSQAAPATGFRTRVSAAPAVPTARNPVRRQASARQTRSNQTAQSNWSAGTKTASAGNAAAAPQTSGWSQTKVTPGARQQTSGTTASPSGATSSVANFFSSIFGAGQSPAKSAGSNNAGKPVVTGATTPSARPSTATSARQSTPRVVRTAAPTTAAAAGASGYDIAVAAVRNQASARALAKRLNTKYADSASWDGKRARVDTLPATALRGRLYSVKLGVYSSLGALASQCEKLIADGLECQVIRRN